MPPAPKQQGIEVVHPYYKITKGLPAAVVRSYKQPMYDSEQLLSASPASEMVLFQKPIGQNLADGTTRKTSLHTNMSNAGQLGTPQSFDVYGFNLRLLAATSVIPGTTNFGLIFAAGVASVIFGTDNPFLTVPIEDIPAGVAVEGLGATDAAHIGLGQSEQLYRFDVGGRALHINSTESFMVKISFPSSLAGVTGNQLFKFYMRGILYKGV
jgi:hypothetical protein